MKHTCFHLQDLLGSLGPCRALASLGLAVVLGFGTLGCKSGGGVSNPFAGGTTRVPPPPTRGTQPTNGYLNNTPGAIGTGVPGTSSVPGGTPAAGATGVNNATSGNWSSTPGAVNNTNGNGVYTSWLERTGTGYNVRSSPTPGAAPPTPPPTPNVNTGSSLPASGQFPSTPDSNVQPASFQQPPPPPTTFPATPETSFAPPATTSTSGLTWRTPR